HWCAGPFGRPKEERVAIPMPAEAVARVALRRDHRVRRLDQPVHAPCHMGDGHSGDRVGASRSENASDPAGAATSPPVDLLARGGGGYANGADRGVGETRGSTAPCPRDSESGTDSRGKDGSPHASDRARY